MLKDDFDHIMNYFKQTAEGKDLNLQELCKESLGFFDKVRQTIEKGNDKEKEEALLIMSDMYQNLMGETKKLAANSGMTEEQLLAFAENPMNFSPDQWKMIQNTRSTMTDTSQSVADYLKTVQPDSEKPEKPESPKKPKRPSRDNWMKS